MWVKTDTVSGNERRRCSSSYIPCTSGVDRGGGEGGQLTPPFGLLITTSLQLLCANAPTSSSVKQTNSVVELPIDHCASILQSIQLSW